MIPKSRFGILLLIIALFCSASKTRALNPKDLLDLVNNDRLTRGLAQLDLNPKLNLAAYAKAQDMIENNYFGHESPSGTKPWYWFKISGYDYAYAGENLAEGFIDSYALETSWMNSPSHRANILSPFYKDMGLAVVNFENNVMVVQFFGTSEERVSLR